MKPDPTHNCHGACMGYLIFQWLGPVPIPTPADGFELEA